MEFVGAIKLVKRYSFVVTCSALFITLLGVGGCVIFGVLAQAAPKIVPAAYDGLKGKSVAVMVWVDRIPLTDWPKMPLDICGLLQQKLLKAQKDPNPAELKGSTFPVTPESIARFQQDHPDADGMPIDQVAKTVGVDRLIYIEVSQFQTRSDTATELYRGVITANVKVIELENGQTKTGYQEDKVTAKYPKKAPDDGVMNIGDDRTYVGTVDEFTTQLAQRFYKHEEERQPGE